MTVLLIGGTGLLGGAIAAELATRGEPLRALVRSGRRAGRLRELGFSLEVGDLRDPRSLRRALRGVRALVTTAQGDPLDRRKRVSAIDGRGNLALVQAAVEAQVEHVVFVSALKADAGAQVPQLAHKRAAEQALEASGLTYTILRPSSFQETFGDEFAPFKRILDRTGVGLTLGWGSGQHSFVAVRDVARAARVALDTAAARNAIVPVGGPDDLSYRGAYRQIARITGRRLLILPIPHLLLRAAGVLAAPLLPDLGGFFALFRLIDRCGYTCTTPGWLVDALGRRRTFAEGVGEMYGVKGN